MCLRRTAFDTEWSVCHYISHKHEMTHTHGWRSQQQTTGTTDEKCGSEQFTRRHNVLYARQQPSGSNAHASESSPRYRGDNRAPSSCSDSTPLPHALSDNRKRCSDSSGQHSRYWYRHSYCRGSLAPLFTQFSLRCLPYSPLMSRDKRYHISSGLPLLCDATDGKWGDPEYMCSCLNKSRRTSRMEAPECLTTPLRQPPNPQGQFTRGRYQSHTAIRPQSQPH